MYGYIFQRLINRHRLAHCIYLKILKNKSLIIFNYCLIRRFSRGSEELKDPYQILGLPKTASKKEIKDIYIQLSKEFHPDVNSSHDAKEKYRRIIEAYKVLSDKESKHDFESIMKKRNYKKYSKRDEIKYDMEYCIIILGSVLFFSNMAHQIKKTNYELNFYGGKTKAQAFHNDLKFND